MQTLRQQVNGLWSTEPSTDESIKDLPNMLHVAAMESSKMDVDKGFPLWYPQSIHRAMSLILSALIYPNLSSPDAAIPLSSRLGSKTAPPHTRSVSLSDAEMLTIAESLLEICMLDSNGIVGGTLISRFLSDIVTLLVDLTLRNEVNVAKQALVSLTCIQTALSPTVVLPTLFQLMNACKAIKTRKALSNYLSETLVSEHGVISLIALFSQKLEEEAGEGRTDALDMLKRLISTIPSNFEDDCLPSVCRQLCKIVMASGDQNIAKTSAFALIGHIISTIDDCISNFDDIRFSPTGESSAGEYLLRMSQVLSLSTPNQMLLKFVEPEIRFIFGFYTNYDCISDAASVLRIYFENADAARFERAIVKLLLPNPFEEQVVEPPSFGSFIHFLEDIDMMEKLGEFFVVLIKRYYLATSNITFSSREDYMSSFPLLVKISEQIHPSLLNRPVEIMWCLQRILEQEEMWDTESLSFSLPIIKRLLRDLPEIKLKQPEMVMALASRISLLIADSEYLDQGLRQTLTVIDRELCECEMRWKKAMANENTENI